MTALIIVDVQNDFTKGTLSLCNAPSKADIAQTIENINNHLSKNTYQTVVYTLDYHPPNHCSFDIWPKHCISNTWGAELDERLIKDPSNCNDYFIIKKGTSPEVDSYSAFIDNNCEQETELRKNLIERNIQNIRICGLALDYCVYHTAIDSIKYGFKTAIIRNCTAPYNNENSKEYQEKISSLLNSGINFI